MSERDRHKWNERYQENAGRSKPSYLVTRYHHLAHVGRALDVACGNGRNSLYLAETGFHVDAVDISEVAIERLAGRHPDIETIRTDLDAWIVPKARYDLIVNIKFLDRRLLPMLENGLTPGGVLIFEAFLSADDDRFCLRPNELLHAFAGLRVVYYEEQKRDQTQKFKAIARFVGVKAGR